MPWMRFLIQRGRGFVLAAGRYLPSASTAESDLSHSPWLGRSCLFSQAEIMGADMKDVLCIATIALTGLCFVVFLMTI